MTNARGKACNIAYWLGLGLWLSALVTAGVAAMNVFGSLPAMQVQLPQYSAMPADSHGRIAAGKVMERVFFTVDLMQFIAIPVTLIAMLLQFATLRLRAGAPANLIRVGCIVIAAALFTIHATAIARPMNRELRSYWRAAESGDVEQAASHLSAFNAKHPVADTLLRINLILLVVAVAASGAALTPPRPSAHAEPRLLRQR